MGLALRMIQHVMYTSLETIRVGSMFGHTSNGPFSRDTKQEAAFGHSLMQYDRGSAPFEYEDKVEGIHQSRREELAPLAKSENGGKVETPLGMSLSGHFQ